MASRKTGQRPFRLAGCRHPAGLILSSVHEGPGCGPGFFMFEPLVVPAINRLLRTNSWATGKLQPHAHKTALLISAFFELRLTVLETGEVGAAPRDVQPDVTISMSPSAVLRA